MAEYYPDSWKLVKIQSESYGTIYKVLASWYGGFAGANSWKLSSGCESVVVDGDTITIPQESGSTYILNKDSEHLSSMIGSVFDSFAATAAEKKTFTIEYVDLEELIQYLSKV